MSIEMIIPSRPSILSLITHWITFPSPTPRMRSQVLWALEILSMAAWRELSNWRMSRRRYCREQDEKKLTSYVRWLTSPSTRVYDDPSLTHCERYSKSWLFAKGIIWESHPNLWDGHLLWWDTWSSMVVVNFCICWWSALRSDSNKFAICFPVLHLMAWEWVWVVASFQDTELGSNVSTCSRTGIHTDIVLICAYIPVMDPIHPVHPMLAKGCPWSLGW